MDLRQTVETVKSTLTKVKIDRQLAGQTSLTPFMSIREGFNKRVTFNMTDGIEQKIDKLTVMMDKLLMEDRGQNRPFNCECTNLTEVEVRLDATMTREDFKTGSDQTIYI